MPLMQAKCTNCGAVLSVDTTKDAAICPYCNSAFIIEKAINNYYMTNTIHANTVNILQSPIPEFEVSGYTLIRYHGNAKEPIIPNTIRKIGAGAFSETIITSITLPEGIEKICKSAFFECEYLDEIKLPQTLKIIECNAFQNCSSLMQISLPASIEHIDASAFNHCTSLTKIHLPVGITRIEPLTFSNCIGLESVVLPSALETIGFNAFENCQNLKSISMPMSVTKIEMKAFYGCSKLTTVDLPQRLSHIDSSAFENCLSLDSITIPESVRIIAYNAFRNTGLRSVRITSANIMIMRCAFADCKNLLDFHIPLEYIRKYYDNEDMLAFCGGSPASDIIHKKVFSIMHRCLYCGKYGVKENGKCPSCRKRNSYT